MSKKCAQCGQNCSPSCLEEIFLPVAEEIYPPFDKDAQDWVNLTNRRSMKDTELRHAFGTLVTWLHPQLGGASVKQLLDMVEQPQVQTSASVALEVGREVSIHELILVIEECMNTEYITESGMTGGDALRELARWAHIGWAVHDS